MTGTDDEWPIHPDNEWPVRPDPEAEKALYVPPDEADNPAEQPKTQRDWKHTIKVYSVFAGIATLVFGFVYITDMFAGDEVGVIVSYLFTLAIGLLYIFKEEDHYVGPDYSKKLREAKPRRALITDDMQIVIDMSTHHDRTTKDGEWPVMQRKTPEPTFEPYEPDKSEEPYLPHVPLSEEPTYFQRIRRTSWVIGCFMLITTVFSMIIGFFYPDETAYPDVQIFFAVVSRRSPPVRRQKPASPRQRSLAAAVDPE